MTAKGILGQIPSEMGNPLKWLQWAPFDIPSGFGGVEMHARCVARELKKLGVDARFSTDPNDLTSTSWDVIHTHGSGLKWDLETKELFFRIQNRISNSQNKRAIRIHAIHGETMGRMKAGSEWLWVRGYFAAARELLGTLKCDIILSDHPNVFLYSLAEKLGKKVVNASNGWDSFCGEDTISEPLPTDLDLALKRNTPYWIFMGRGGDRMKGVDRLIPALKAVPEIKLVASPGEGFESVEGVLKTGKISPGQLKTFSAGASGLILSSRYEGLALVVLEALGQGMRVVSTPVGGLPTLSPDLKGLIFTRDETPEAIADALREALKLPWDQDVKNERALHNRKLISSWADVAKRALDAVTEFRANRVP